MPGAYGIEIDDGTFGFGADTGGADGVLVHIQFDVDSGIVHGADPRSGTMMSDCGYPSCGTGRRPIRGTSPAEVSLFPVGNHTV